MISGVFAQAQPAELVVAFFAGHVIAAVGFLDGRFAAWTFSVLGLNYLIFRAL